MFSMLVNATFSIVAMVIHMDAAIPETTQLAHCLNQHLYVMYHLSCCVRCYFILEQHASNG